MCLKEKGDHDLQTLCWKMCSESMLVSHEAISRWQFGVCTHEDETAQHFLMECLAQSVLRRELKLKTNLTKMSPMFSNPATTELNF